MLASLMIAGLVGLSESASSPLADIGPAPRTVLVDSAGKPFDLASLKGKVVLVSFVYTTCTGVCPGTTQAMVRVKNALKEAELWGSSVAFVSITLDPSRDTADVLNRYAKLFRADDSAWHFLTGPPADVASVIADWGMWVKTGPTGALDHPSRRLPPRSTRTPARDLQPGIPDAPGGAPGRPRAAGSVGARG